MGMPEKGAKMLLGVAFVDRPRTYTKKGRGTEEKGSCGLE